MNANDAIYLERWIRHREADAFREIVTRYAGMVYGAARRVLGGSDGAEDVAQECFQTLATAEKAPSSYLGPWLHRVATNLALKRVRTDTRRRAREEAYTATQTTSVEPTWDDIYQYVDEAIAALPDDLREPIVAHYLEGHSQTEIARALDVPRQTLTNRIHKGIDEIRESLRRRGIEVGTAALGTLLVSHLAEAAVAPASLLASAGRIALAGRASGAMTGAFAGVVSGPKVLLLIGLVLCGGLTWFAASTLRESDPASSSSASPREVEADVNRLSGEPDSRPIDTSGTGTSGGAEALGTTESEPISTALASNSEYGAISGAIRFRGQAMADMGVQLDPGNGDERSEAKTDDSGVYLFEEVPPGNHTVLGWLIPGEDEDFPLLTRRERGLVEPGAATELDFDFPAAGGFLEGMVTYQGQPVADTGYGKCSLRVTDAAGAKVYGQGAGIGANGRFAFEKVPGGSATLEVWATVKEEGQPMELRQSAQFDMPENGDIFREIALEKQSDTLVVQLQGFTDQFDGSISLLKGDVDIEDVTLEFLESLAPRMVTGRNLRGQKVVQFGHIEPGEYTVLLMAIDRKYLEEPEEEQLQHGRFSFESLTVVDGQTYVITFSLE